MKERGRKFFKTSLVLVGVVLAIVAAISRVAAIDTNHRYFAYRLGQRIGTFSAAGLGAIIGSATGNAGAGAGIGAAVGLIGGALIGDQMQARQKQDQEV